MFTSLSITEFVCLLRFFSAKWLHSCLWGGMIDLHFSLMYWKAYLSRYHSDGQTNPILSLADKTVKSLPLKSDLRNKSDFPAARTKPKSQSYYFPNIIPVVLEWSLNREGKTDNDGESFVIKMELVFLKEMSDCGSALCVFTWTIMTSRLFLAVVPVTLTALAQTHAKLIFWLILSAHLHFSDLL